MASAYSTHHHVKALVQTQPRLFRFTWRGLMYLPYRLCNPPPAVGKVRSCGLTPIFDVKLEDVLDRRHLPPLGLKDFEEWLLFVEQSPENLYFILWLRDYTAKYNRWAAKAKSRSRRKREDDEKNGGYRVNWSADASPSLAMSYARARQTFFAPNSGYALCVPPDLLSPFFSHPAQDPNLLKHSSSHSPAHPDPAVFHDLALEVQRRLRGSLHNCVRAAYSNVGTFRATCGICAGLVISLAGALPPLLVNFLGDQSRWLRLAALPGLWLGLTVFIASLRGVCMMVYVFGDFRQLRKFELERPPPAYGETTADSTFAYGTGSQQFMPYQQSAQAHSAVHVCAPASPPRALTAPPKITISIPNRHGIPPTPSLSYSHSRPTTSASGSASGYASGYTSTGNSGETTLHTISISSSRKSGEVVGEPDDARSERSSISIPGCDSSDTDSMVSSVDDGLSQYEDDGGIYISPAYAPQDETELLDASTIAAAYRAANSDEDRSTTKPGSRPATGSGSGAAAAPSADAPPPLPAPTAAFIPPETRVYEEWIDESGRAKGDVEWGLPRFDGGPSAEMVDGAGVPGEGNAKVEEVLALGKRTPVQFDFDALPPLQRDRPAPLCVPPISTAMVATTLTFSNTLTQTNTTTLRAGSVTPPHPTSEKALPMSQLSSPLSPSSLHPLYTTAASASASSPKHRWGAGAILEALFCDTTNGWRGRFAAARRVPAFGPVTRVLNPVVARAQWEIVVRACVLAGLLSWALVGALLAVPVHRAGAQGQEGAA